mmetsp:Transcript_10555/g.30160  ORF Transcript_10555/g.30160 Transcript_10555/m.30160 type:complete len:216 (-) Transcript_10555:139-786(-)
MPSSSHALSFGLRMWTRSPLEKPTAGAVDEADGVARPRCALLAPNPRISKHSAFVAGTMLRCQEPSKFTVMSPFAATSSTMPFAPFEIRFAPSEELSHWLRTLGWVSKSTFATTLSPGLNLGSPTLPAPVGEGTASTDSCGVSTSSALVSASLAGAGGSIFFNAKPACSARIHKVCKPSFDDTPTEPTGYSTPPMSRTSSSTSLITPSLSHAWVS